MRVLAATWSSRTIRARRRRNKRTRKHQQHLLGSAACGFLCADCPQLVLVHSFSFVRTLGRSYNDYPSYRPGDRHRGSSLPEVAQQLREGLSWPDPFPGALGLLSPVRRLHSAALSESPGLGGHGPASPTGLFAVPAAAACSPCAAGPGRCLVPGLAEEEEAEAALPRGAGKPAGWAEGLGRAEGCLESQLSCCG